MTECRDITELNIEIEVHQPSYGAGWNDCLDDMQEQLTTTQQALDAALIENTRYKKKKDDEQRVRECLFRDFTKAVELCAKTQQALDEKQADLNFMWRWIERAVFDSKNTSPEAAIGVLQYYDNAPWYKNRDKWDTSHKEYDAEINKAISDRQALDKAVEALKLYRYARKDVESIPNADIEAALASIKE